ncbi:MAG: D-glycero-alpha-D-manno-heptose-1,7-bisphosphate 7-phosphatase [Xenococcaceae cyanobacterium]
MEGNRALFIDRDGVINLDYGYVSRPEQIEFVNGIFELCRHAHALGYLIFVVTNQSGIGRGYYTEAAFHRLMDWMGAVFRDQGCPIAQVYFCPYHPTAGVGQYRRESSWRKPKPGMILAAAEDFDLDMSCSVLVGDRPRDIEAGQAAGVGCNLLYAQEPLPNFAVVPTAIVATLSQVQLYLKLCPNSVDNQ